MGKIFCIIGKSCSGKDSIFKKLIEDKSLNLKSCVLYTTRPQRSGETDGIEYNFIDGNQLELLKIQGKIIEIRKYKTVKGDWYYATVDDGQIKSECNYLMIVTLKAYNSLKKFYGKNSVIPIYIFIDDYTRLNRAIERERLQINPDYKEMCRRFIADCNDFSDNKLVKYGIKKFYENNDLKKCIEEIYNNIKLQI